MAQRLGPGTEGYRLVEGTPLSALARLRRAEQTMADELAVVREAIREIEASLDPAPSGGPLLTVVEAARELRVS